MASHSTHSEALPIHGNYRGYYTKRPFVNDPRVALLSSSFFTQAVVLDIGCNEGWVTCEIAQQWNPKKVVGVDIDPELIRAAWRRRRTVWSLQEPESTIQREEADVQHQSSKKRKRPDSDDVKRSSNPKENYFPLAMEHMFGPLPIPSSTPETQERFPHNVSFRCADWVAKGLPEDAEGYDVILALSVSKWIHLNGGDEGLMTFFRRVSSVLRHGGKFVLEPQAWDTYAKAKRMDTKLKETAKALKLRPEGFSELLKELEFDDGERLGTIGEGGFCRPVDVYVKR